MLFINSCKKVLTGFLFFISLFIISISCDSTEPTDELKPGRRDYTWTVDTLRANPFLYLSAIWGNSPIDVWAVGSGGGSDKTIWHYDGFSWTTDGVSRYIEPYAVHGFSDSDIWIAGGEGNIWRYDGNQWKFSHQYLITGFRGFNNIWGDMRNNIYAVGFADSANISSAIILHYDGKSWSKKMIPYYNIQFLRIKRDLTNGLYYLRGMDNNGTIVSLFEYDGNITLKNIYENSFSIETNAIAQSIGSKVCFLIGYKINKYENQQFKPFVEINEPGFGGQFWGRSEKDIFLRMFDGVAHYNGSDIRYIINFNKDDNISVTDVALFEKECFILTTDYNNGQSIIYKGKLD